jgi:hypothetical protein
LSDLLFYAALVLLPFDGTVAGIPLPYWMPLSPWFFLAYALVNFRHLRVVARRYLPFVLLPLLLVLVSFYGWTTIGFYGWAAARSIGSVVLALGCLASLEIALRVKRLPWKPMVTVLVATYGFAFIVGVVQWVACEGHQTVLCLAHVPQLHVGTPAVPLRRAELHRHASVRRATADILADP